MKPIHTVIVVLFVGLLVGVCSYGVGQVLLTSREPGREPPMRHDATRMAAQDAECDRLCRVEYKYPGGGERVFWALKPACVCWPPSAEPAAYFLLRGAE
jgi:hypothetical protein